MILFRAEAILASSISKFGKFLPAIDRENLNYSTESTISTSLIHDMASEGKSEQAETCFLNLIFHHQNVEGVGNLSNCSSDICCLCCTAIEFCGMSTGKREFNGRRPSSKCRHWNCASNRCPCTDTHWNRTCCTWCRRVKNSLIRCL